MDWTPYYKLKAAGQKLSPVYCMFVEQDSAPLQLTVDAEETDLLIDTNENLNIEAGDDALFYDDTGWEMITVGGSDSTSYEHPRGTGEYAGNMQPNDAALAIIHTVTTPFAATKIMFRAWVNYSDVAVEVRAYLNNIGSPPARIDTLPNANLTLIGSKTWAAGTFNTDDTGFETLPLSSTVTFEADDIIQLHMSALDIGQAPPYKPLSPTDSFEIAGWSVDYSPPDRVRYLYTNQADPWNATWSSSYLRNQWGTPLKFVDSGGFTEGESLDTLTGVIRGAHQTNASAHTRGAWIFNMSMQFATGTVEGTDAVFTGGLSFPSGCRNTLLYQEGRVQTEAVTIDVQDKNAVVTGSFADSFWLGKKAIIMGGYKGMNFADYSILYIGKITDLTFRRGVYHLTLDNHLSSISKNLFSQVEDFDSTLAAAINSTTTSITLTNEDNVYGHSRANLVGVERWAALYFKIDNEIMRQETSGDYGGGAITVTRGRLYTTAASHAKYTTVDYFFGINDTPIDILLYLLCTRPYSFTASGPLGESYDLHIGSGIDRELGVGLNYYDIDIASFEEIRDSWFVNDIWCVKFYRKTNIRRFIENNILQTINCNLYINKLGQIALAMIRPPIIDSPPVLDESDIVGDAQLQINTDTVLNDVVVKFDYDTSGSSNDNELTLLDATSIATWDIDNEIVLEAIGVDSNYGGATLANIYAHAKVRNFKNPNPVIPLEALFNRQSIEPGVVVNVQIPQLPDVYAGTIGWDKYMAVVGKRVRWEDGTLEFEMIDTVYYGQLYCLIAPDTLTDDWAAASQADKDRYGFISDSDGLMSDGSPGDVIA